ncbi:hypothetical protein Syun_030212 [Stephania yunnanensis]|uniref:Uncharacterized protein n=1 Tax=Stephania yunnanensis TaxID=152371 RepID=A0AAP0EEM0_9MAGN
MAFTMQLKWLVGNTQALVHSLSGQGMWGYQACDSFTVKENTESFSASPHPSKGRSNHILEYHEVGPQHSMLKDIGRAEYYSIIDEEALEGGNEKSLVGDGDGRHGIAGGGGGKQL